MRSPILTGATATIPQTGAQIKLDHFNYRYDPIQTKAGLVYQPIDYVSQVQYVGKDGVARSATIRVNHPLDIDGTLYYQAAYGFGAQFVLTKDGRVTPNSPPDLLKEGDSFSVGGDRALEYDQFVGTIDPKTGRPTADPRPNNPAVVVRMIAGDTALASGMIPVGSSLDLGGGYRLSVPRYAIYSGFQYRYDPGMGLVGIGALVLLTGLCTAFYFLPARLYVKLSGGGRKWNLGIAATTVKGYEVFEDQFRELVAALRRAATGRGNQRHAVRSNLARRRNRRVRHGRTRVDCVLPLTERADAPHRDAACDRRMRRAVCRAGHALGDLRHLAAHQSLRIAFAFLGDGRADFPDLRLPISILDSGRLRAVDRGDRAWLRDDLERRLHAAGSGAAILLDQDSRSARRLVVRGVHAFVRRLGAVFDQVLRRTALRKRFFYESRRRNGGRFDSGDDTKYLYGSRGRRDRDRHATRRHAGDCGRCRKRQRVRASGLRRCRASPSST